MGSQRVVVVGAGIGGLVSALLLAARGLDVTVLERGNAPGGKLRAVMIDGRPVDSGPTVLTLRSILEEIFAEAGIALEAHLRLRPADILARHAWSDGARLDLHADRDRTAEAIATFAGAGEARRFRAFADAARASWRALEHPFVRAERPSLLRLVTRGSAAELKAIRPFATLWRALGDQFRDPRLRQLFARYATYCGGSPFEAPATLMLVAHVEQEGVWLVDGGMHRIATVLAALAVARGATIRYRADVTTIRVAQGAVAGVTLGSGERVDADAVVANVDVAALGGGAFGADARRAAAATARTARSLSAVTWSLVAPCDGFPLVRHNVFFSDDYPAEFRAIAGGALPGEPTVYVAAQDREAEDGAAPGGPERLFLIVNAPATGDVRPPGREEVERCEEATFRRLAAAGLTIRRRREATVVTTPADFAQMFPATGGALYGPAPHGWMAAFRRPGTRTPIAGLYLAGGSIHPGPGVPMAALSGRQAAASLWADWASIARSRRVAMPGGTSMRSATTGGTASR